MKHEVTHPLTKILLPVVSGLCRHAENLDVWEQDHGGMLELRFTPDLADIRIVVGKAGRQSKALKFVGQEIARRMGIQLDLRIEEGIVGDRNDRSPFTFNPAFRVDDVWPVLDPVLEGCFGRKIERTFRVENAIFKIDLHVADEEMPLAHAIGDLFYPFGMGRGRRIEVKPANAAYGAAK